MNMNFLAGRAPFLRRTGLAGRHYNVIDSCKEISSPGGTDCLPGTTDNAPSALLPVFVALARTPYAPVSATATEATNTNQRARPPRESGASSNHRLMGFVSIEITG